MTRRVRTGIVVVGMILLAASCSGDEGAEPTSTTSGTTTTVGSFGPAAVSGQPQSPCRTPDTPPAHAADERLWTKRISDVDGDGADDYLELWRSGGKEGVGVFTTTHAEIRVEDRFPSFSPRSAFAVDVDESGTTEIITSDGREAHLWVFDSCRIVPVRNVQGAQYTFDLGLGQYGTGVGCGRVGGRRKLVGHNVVGDDGTTVRWKSTVIELTGDQARNGATTEGTSRRPGDARAIADLRSVTCGDLALNTDGVRTDDTYGNGLPQTGQGGIEPFIRAWVANDRDTALLLADKGAVDTLFAFDPGPAPWTQDYCGVGSGLIFCIYLNGIGGEVIARETGTGTLPAFPEGRVVEVTSVEGLAPRR